MTTPSTNGHLSTRRVPDDCTDGTSPPTAALDEVRSRVLELLHRVLHGGETSSSSGPGDPPPIDESSFGALARMVRKHAGGLSYLADHASVLEFEVVALSRPDARHPVRFPIAKAWGLRLCAVGLTTAAAALWARWITLDSADGLLAGLIASICLGVPLAMHASINADLGRSRMRSLRIVQWLLYVSGAALILAIANRYGVEREVVSSSQLLAAIDNRPFMISADLVAIASATLLFHHADRFGRHLSDVVRDRKLELALVTSQLKKLVARCDSAAVEAARRKRKALARAAIEGD